VLAGIVFKVGIDIVDWASSPVSQRSPKVP